MPITTHTEDLLPEIQSQVPVEFAAYAMAQEAMNTVPAAPGILRDISGCVSLIGPISICYDLNLSIPSAAISLKVGPVTVISGEIDPENPCLSLSGSYGIAKWKLAICLRLAQKAITLEGQACATFSGCRNFNITLIHWGDPLWDDEVADVKYPAYQCLKTNARQVYCSKNKLKSHDEGNAWVKRCMEHFGINSNELKGKPYLSDSIPNGAIVYP